MTQTIYEETKYLMKKYHITANKSLGQNFLISDEVVEEMVESADVNEHDLIIEIGPGLGTLTKQLLKSASKVVVVEIDNRMIQILQDRFSEYSNFELINEDILKVDLRQKIKEEKSKDSKINNVKIVANLPYYITTPIVMKLLEDKLDLYSITVMVQKEVAERLISNPGDRLSGAITYSVYYYAETSGIIEVPKESFIPQPEVESKVIQLKIRKQPQIELVDEKMFFKLIKLIFSQRRKTLANVLVNGGIVENKESANKLLEKMELSANCRGETLTIEKFAQIANYLCKTL